MRLRHFEALKPLCPVCRTPNGGGLESSLLLTDIFHEDPDGAVIEGLLRCSAVGCLREYPIIDGIPLIIPGLRAWVEANLVQVLARNDLSPTLDSLIGDCCGPGSAYDAIRQHVSTYAESHYGDLVDLVATGDQCEQDDRNDGGGILELLDRALALAEDFPDGPLLDVGCSVGRTTFALAQRYGDRLVLGVDLHYGMLKLASRVLREGEAWYPRRRVGVVYERCRFKLPSDDRSRVDFWACDAIALPFADGTFAGLGSLNVIDCVASPYDALSSVAKVLASGGKGWLSTPYDWSPAATPYESWLGGHSQRGPERGASEPILRRLLTSGAHPSAVEGLEVVGELVSVPWRLRLHARSTMEYAVDLVALRRL